MNWDPKYTAIDVVNNLLNNKSIAKISSKPGKTLLINHFRVNDKLFIVDLPGYGYATVSKKIKEDIKNIHENYFKLRKELLYTLLLIDIRHDIQKKDIEFMEFLISNYCPFVIIFTKSDKLKNNQLEIPCSEVTAMLNEAFLYSKDSNSSIADEKFIKWLIRYKYLQNK